MRKNLFIAGLSVIVSFVILSFTEIGNVTGSSNDNINEASIGNSDPSDWNSCVEKVESEWGGKCLNYGFSESKYTVTLVNTCAETVDLMSCVQRDNGRWQCFYRLDMKQKDTLFASACRGSGKYLKWVREAGDITTRFPTLSDVNDQY